jgi:hypothetical protein
MRKILCSIILLLLCCTTIVAQDTSGTTIKGKLYSIKDGKETSPPPGRLNVGYWDDKGQLLSNMVGTKEDGKVVIVSTIGTARIREDGTFAITIDRKEIPTKNVIVGIYYRPDGSIDNFLVRKEDGDGLRIEIQGDVREIDLEKAIGKILVTSAEARR